MAKEVTPGKRKYKFRLSLHILDRKKPLESDWWIRYRGQDFFTKTVIILAPSITKLKKTQPIGVIEGYASQIAISHDEVYDQAVIYE